MIGTAVGLGLVGVAAAGGAVSWATQRAAEAATPVLGRGIDVGGRRLHVLDRPGSDPAAPTLVFVHGASGNLRDLALAFDGAFPAHRCVFLDRPGHGWSERRGRADSSPAVQAGLVAALLDRLGIDRAVVIGHSWGAAVTAAFGVLHPERTLALAFLAPATHPWPGGVDPLYRLAVAPLIGRLFVATTVAPIGRMILDRTIAAVFAPDPVPEDYRRRIGAELVLRPATFRANAEDVADLKDHVILLSPRYREIAVPCLVVTGTQDPIVWPSIHAEGLVRDIAGARLVRLDGVGHMPHHAARDRVIAEIAALVGEVGAG